MNTTPNIEELFLDCLALNNKADPGVQNSIDISRGERIISDESNDNSPVYQMTSHHESISSGNEFHTSPMTTKMLYTRT